MPYVDAAARKAYLVRYRAKNPEKIKAYQVRYRAENPEKMKAYHARYRAENAEKRKAYNARYGAKNPEKIKAYDARYYAKNSEKIKAYRARYYVENAEKIKASSARYGAKNPEKKKTYGAKRRACKLSAGGGGITARQWNDVLTSTGGLCSYCNERRPLTLDHIVPLSAGGQHDIENAVAACKSCNSAKNKTPLVLWLARRAA